MKPMNRADRRKIATKFATDVLKEKDKAASMRAQSAVKKQFGFAIVITNLLIALTIGRRVFVFRDRRLA